MSSEYKPHTLIDVATLTGYVAQPHQTCTQFTRFVVQSHDDRPRRSLLRRLLRKPTIPTPKPLADGRSLPPSFRQTSDELWQKLHVAGETEYDRFWRMPLDEDYGPQIYSSNADLQNVRLSFPPPLHSIPALTCSARRLGDARQGASPPRCS